MSFIFKITTTTSPQTFVIPCVDEGTFNATVDYGDGTGSQTVTAYNDSNLTHSFATAGQHTITIDGTFPNIRFYDNAASAALVDEVVDLGDVGWLSLGRGFRDCTNLTDFNVGTADTSSVTSTIQMVFNCSSLTTLDLSSFDTSSVTTMQQMFQNCTNLTTLDLSNFNTSSVTTMYAMFFNCNKLTTLNLSSFDISSVTSVSSMQEMFNGCSSLTSLDVSSFDTSSVTSMQSMFRNCTNLTNLDIKHFDISSVTNGTNFLLNANNALTTTAYDELLEVWAAQDVQPNVPWHFGDAQYTVETIADWYSPRNASSLSIINNKLVSIADSTNTFGAAQQIDNLIVGNAYKVKATVSLSQVNSLISFRVASDSSLSGSSMLGLISTGTANIDNTFIATATTIYVGVIVGSPQPIIGDTITIDAGISVKEITNYTEANAASEIEYSQENVFGAEEVVNGDFATDLSGWTVYSQTAVWSVDGIVIDGSSDTAQVSQLLSLQANSTYEVSMTNVGKTLARILLGTDWWNSDVYFSSDSTEDIKFYVTPTVSSVWLQLNIHSGVIATLDNVSVKEITNAVTYENIPQTARELYTLEDDTWVGSELVVNGDFATDSDWIKGTGISISGGSAVFDSVPSTQILRQSIVFKIGAKYIVTFTISGYVEGGIFVRQPANDQSNTFTSNGTHTTTITASAAGPFDLRAAGVTTLLIDNVSVKEIIEVAEQAAFSPVTAPMTLTEAWTTRGTAYLGLQNTTSASVRVDATISNTDNGVLMESGGAGIGSILYVYNGVLYFQCGKGDAYGTASNRAEVSYTLPVGEADYIIEWSADTSNAVLYVNGLVVGSQAFSESIIVGSDAGTLGEVEGAVAVNRGGWTTDGSGVYTNTITKCDVFNNQITSDV